MTLTESFGHSSFSFGSFGSRCTPLGHHLALVPSASYTVYSVGMWGNPFTGSVLTPKTLLVVIDVEVGNNLVGNVGKGHGDFREAGEADSERVCLERNRSPRTASHARLGYSGERLSGGRGSR